MSASCLKYSNIVNRQSCAPIFSMGAGGYLGPLYFVAFFCVIALHMCSDNFTVQGSTCVSPADSGHLFHSSGPIAANCCSYSCQVPAHPMWGTSPDAVVDGP